MKLTEALKTGKKIRRSGDQNYFQPQELDDFTVRNIMSDEWEVEPQVVEFECEFRTENPNDGIFRRKLPVFDPNTKDWEHYSSVPDGAKCRVTVEVIE